MAKIKLQSNAATQAIFNDLERFLNFCRDYGYRYNESDLHNFKSYAWQQYNKYINGKNAKDMWAEDARRFAGNRRA